MCKVTFDTNSGTLRMFKEDGTSYMIGHINYFKVEPMIGEPGTLCVRITDFNDYSHFGTLYPDEILPREKVSA